MRIIKPGRKPKKEIEQTCERCGCVFAYGEEDIDFGYHYGERFVPEHYVICPHCSKIIEVEPWSGY